MSRLEAIVETLTPEQRREVEDFAEFLAQKRSDNLKPTARISFEGWAGCLAHVDKSGVELQHEALEEWSKASEDSACS